MFNCKEISERSSDYLDRELPLSERMAFGFHLLLCGHCRRFISHMRIAAGIFDELSSQQQELSKEEAEELSGTILDRADKEE